MLAHRMPSLVATLLPFLLGSALFGVPAAESAAQSPLHQQIDELLTVVQTGSASAPAGDAEFLRRVSLDLIGTVPSPAELREFLASADADKRAKAVERLIADPRFDLHWAEVLDVMLMERRPDKHVPHAEWLKYLQASVRQNKPWNVLVRELVTSDGTDPDLRPAAKFFLDREAEPHTLTRDVGRIFFGVDLQCAQCHDHPLVDHYLQADYYGLFAFVNRTVLFNDEAQKKMLLGEKAEGDADYKSVFTGDASRTRPRLPGGDELDEPHFALGDEYVTAPADKVRPVPKHSRRTMLAKATEGGNGAFDRNLPNRLWAQLFGRGLVHPVDWHHPHNPPSHPEVLDRLTREFVASGYNIRDLIRQLALTQAYQRSFDYPTDKTSRLALAAERIPALEQTQAELEAASKTALDSRGNAYATMKAARDALTEPDQIYQKALQAAIALRKPLADAEAALKKTQDQIAQKQTVIATLTEAGAKAAEAVKALPNDAEVAQAAAVFTKKTEAANAEVAALQKTAGDQTAAVDAAKAKLQEAVAASEAAYAAYASAAQPWEDAKKTWWSARLATLSADAQLAAVKQQISRWQQSAEYAQQLAQRAAAEQAVPVAQTELKAAEQAVAEQMTQVATATSAVTAAQQDQQAAQQQLDAAKTDLGSRQTVAKPVGDAVAQVELALQKLPEDAELTEVLAKLKSRYEPLGSAVKEAEELVATRTTEHQAATSKLGGAQQQLATAQAELSQRQQTMAAKTTALQEAQQRVAETHAAVDATWGALAETWAREFNTRIEKPLSPEQLTYALATATGFLDLQRGSADAEIEKTIPRASVADDAAKLADRQWKVEQLLRERMRGHVNAFVNLYGAGQGQPQDQFFATADQALFFANGGTVRSWINPAGQNLAARLGAIQEPAPLAEELYQSTLMRSPTPQDVAMVSDYLSKRTMDRPLAIQELIWGLLSSAEFRFNL